MPGCLEESRPPRLADAWPKQVRTTWSHYESDGLCHASFWVAEWPRIPVGADFLGPMFLHSRGTRTISIVMEPTPPAQAAREVLDARTAFLADQRIRDAKGYVPTAFRDAEGLSLAQREADLAAGHGEFRFSAYVTVSAPDCRSAGDDGHQRHPPRQSLPAAPVAPLRPAGPGLRLHPAPGPGPAVTEPARSDGPAAPPVVEPVPVGRQRRRSRLEAVLRWAERCPIAIAHDLVIQHRRRQPR